VTFDPDATWEEREDSREESELWHPSELTWRELEERELRALFPPGDVLELLDPLPQGVHEGDEDVAA
jgi:hypothetical protein